MQAVISQLIFGSKLFGSNMVSAKLERCDDFVQERVASLLAKAEWGQRVLLLSIIGTTVCRLAGRRVILRSPFALLPTVSAPSRSSAYAVLLAEEPDRGQRAAN